jgi:predicted nucleic acid-binding protein
MIVLDTNVLSEPLRPRPDERVLARVAAQADHLAVTAITIGELLTGILLLPEGRRRQLLLAAAEELLLGLPEPLVYDVAAARELARIRVPAKEAGRGLTVEDAMIAAICLRNDATLATRNTKHFEHVGVRLIDPWEH